MSGEAPAAATAAPPPTKIPPPVAAGPNGSAALADGVPKPTPSDNPFEFELEVKGQKQKLNFATKDQLTAVLQKALYADQVIKDGIQAKRGAEALMSKLKTPEGVREILTDPDINIDIKKFALGIVQEMMEEEKLTPEQRRIKELEKYQNDSEATKKSQQEAEANRKKQEQFAKDRAEASGKLIEAMKKHPDLPQTQATVDAMILNMRAAYRRFGKHLTPDQAMAVYSEQYWTSHLRMVEKMTPEQLNARYTPKMLDRINEMKLNLLRKKTNPANQKQVGDGAAKKKKHLTEREFDQHFQELAGGL